jgi:hypothetical protein
MLSETDHPTADAWINNTRLVRAWQDRRQEIQLHKWYESEKAGHDIGWERATVSYMLWLAHGTRN